MIQLPLVTLKSVPRRSVEDRAIVDVVKMQESVGLKAVTDGEYHPAESASELAAVFDGLPTSVITRHEVVELSVAFVALGAVLVFAALLNAWTVRRYGGTR